jgi:hypothetical protein|tara:strand:- start:3219 stop:3440 length:222 start_codon:yes stop_codon:yes gene_type:complete
LRFRVNVLDYDIDGFSWVRLVQIDRLDQIVVLEDLWRCEGARQHLLGEQWFGLVELGGCEARDSRYAARKKRD